MTIHIFMTIAVFPISLLALVSVCVATHRHVFDPFFTMNLLANIVLSVGGWVGVAYCLWVWGLLR